MARIAGKAVFIDGALPGERVTFRFLKRRGGHDEGVAAALLVAAPERVAPRCAHFRLCGGCSLQHLSPEAQLGHKEGVLMAQLAHIGGLRPTRRLEPVAAEPWAYRRRARLSVKFVEKKAGCWSGSRSRAASGSRSFAPARCCTRASAGTCSVCAPSSVSSVPPPHPPDRGGGRGFGDGRGHSPFETALGDRPGAPPRVCGTQRPRGVFAAGLCGDRYPSVAFGGTGPELPSAGRGRDPVPAERLHTGQCRDQPCAGRERRRSLGTGPPRSGPRSLLRAREFQSAARPPGRRGGGDRGRSAARRTGTGKRPAQLHR